MKAWQVTDRASLDLALDAALAYSGPSFIDLIVESIADVAPPIASWICKLGHDPLSLEPHDRIQVVPGGWEADGGSGRRLERRDVRR